jgi:hypothetical protein
MNLGSVSDSGSVLPNIRNPMGQPSTRMCITPDTPATPATPTTPIRQPSTRILETPGTLNSTVDGFSSFDEAEMDSGRCIFVFV